MGMGKKQEILMNKNDSSVQPNELLLQLTKAVFWNCDIDKFDYLRDKKYIIERIIDGGLENDEIIMWKLYSYDDIKNVALNMEYLHEDIVTYMAFVLKVKEDEFKCYKKKPWYKK
jgi:hypothetical protein